jgi:outer membrane protein, heavy metal efflux system
MLRSTTAALLIVAGTGCARYQARPLSAEKTAADFDRRSLDDPGLRRFLERNPGAGLPGGRAPARWGLAPLTYVAFYYHPSLEVARAQWALAEAGILTAGARPNPRIGVTAGFSFNPPDFDLPWLPAVSFEWSIETAGKRGHRLRGAQQLSEAARWDLIAAAWQVRARVRASLLELRGARERVRLLEAQLAAQLEVLRLLDQRLQAGAVAATDVTPARLTMLRALTDLGEARRLQAEARVRLGQALGLPQRAVAGVELDFELDLPAAAAAQLSSAVWRRRALLGRSDILAALARYAASESALQLEVARQYPDVRLGTTYEFDQGQHKWMLGGGVELPLLNRNQGPIAEAKARRELRAAQFLALQSSVIGDIDRAIAAGLAAREHLQQSEAIVATQRKLLRVAEGAFALGGIGRLELQIARAEAAATELVHLDALLRVQQAHGLLEEAVQAPIDTRVLEEKR